MIGRIKSFLKRTILRLIKDFDTFKTWEEGRITSFEKQKYEDLLSNENAASSQEQITVVNLNANDICNSKCVMCNIWQQKKDFEITPYDLQKILADPLFKSVKHIGVTGGEPTMRSDLAQLNNAILETLPDLSGISTITNCIKEKDVINRINEVIEVSNKKGKPFSMMVSLDGYRETHDLIRGTKGNFDKVINVIQYFQGREIPVISGTTVSKQNVWKLDELLDFMIEKNIYGRFRVAEFINRLYNTENKDVIRNFDEDETYNLILFFYKLILTFEKNPTYLRTYRSIINVLNGGERLIGCPYQKNGVVLDSRGNLAYCAPKSKILGNALKESAQVIYHNNLDELTRIKNNECKNCIHDYHASITANEYHAEASERYWKRRIKLGSNLLSLTEIQELPTNRYFDFQIFITGWYGTETVGDKAILAGIIDELSEKYQNQNIGFVVSSLYPIITERTMWELKIENFVVVPVYSEKFVCSVKGSDIVIMGGGPLMDLEELALPLISFQIAKNKSIKTIIYGCGIGPLFVKNKIDATKKILLLADEILLRDQKSGQIAAQWVGSNKIKIIGDPSKNYLKRVIKKLPNYPVKSRLSCFLRDWTYEYSRDMSIEDFRVQKASMELRLSEYIKKKARDLEVDEIYFDHMHNFVVGNDDRDFSRYFIKTYFKNSKIPVIFNEKISTVESILQTMKTSKHNLCMRFHSVVFASEVGDHFTAFDYTKGGKILNYLNDNNMTEKLLTVETLLND